MSTDLIKRLRDELGKVVVDHYPSGWEDRSAVVRYTGLIAEADAHLASAAQSREATLERENAELRESENENDTLRHSLSDKLTRIAVTLKGEPPALTLWSWHDLPELVAALARENAKMMPLLIDVTYALEKARIWNGTGYTYNSLPAFVYEPIYDRVVAALHPKEPTNG